MLFGYMAKALAVQQAPYALTVFVDTDTFVCDAAPIVALPRVMGAFDLLLLFPRSAQGWVNSGMLVVRREAVGAWGVAWAREFLSLDDFGDQLHLLKVARPLLPPTCLASLSYPVNSVRRCCPPRLAL